jgi:hypothetical protein
VNDSSTLTLKDFVIDYVHFEEAGAASSSSSSSSSTSAPSSPSAPASPPPMPPASPPPAPLATPCSPTLAPYSPALVLTPPRSAPAASVHDEQYTVEFATPLSNDEDRVDAYYDDEPLRYRTLDISSVINPSLDWRCMTSRQSYTWCMRTATPLLCSGEGRRGMARHDAAGDGRGRAELDVGAGGSSYRPPRHHP